MNGPPILIDASGNRCQLERVLASGGEGSIYTLQGNVDFVVKRYHAADQPNPRR